VLAKQLSEKGNLDLIPGSFLHVWAARHSQFLLNHVHLRDGASPFLIATGKQLKVSFAQFGESVHWRVPEPLKQGKSAPRWKRGIWVGIDEKSGGHVVLNSEGAHMCRVVKRLAPNMLWDQQALIEARGLPWNQQAGVTGKQKNDVKGAPMLESILEEPEDVDRIPVIMAPGGQAQEVDTESAAGPDSPSEAASPDAVAAPLSVASSMAAAAPTPQVNPPMVNPPGQEGTLDETRAMADVDDRGEKRKADEPAETFGAMTTNSI
jgi:hypothetical protein